MRNQVTVTFIVRIHECDGCHHQTFPACRWLPRGQDTGAEERNQWGQIGRPSFIAGHAALPFAGEGLLEQGGMKEIRREE